LPPKDFGGQPIVHVNDEGMAMPAIRRFHGKQTRTRVHPPDHKKSSALAVEAIVEIAAGCE